MRKLLLSLGFAALAMSAAAQNVYFAEDFEWLKDWCNPELNGNKAVGKTIEENNSSAEAPQIKTPKVGDETALKALENKGYVFHRVTTKTEGECIYLQETYLKMGKTSYQAGFTLPLIDQFGTGVSNVKVSFDWSPVRQAEGKPAAEQVWDPTKLVVIVTNGEDEKTFDVPTLELTPGEAYAWHPADIELKDVTLTKDSKITIRNCDEQWPIGKAMRWFIDNIKVYSADSGTGVAGIEVDGNAPVEYYNLQGIRVANPENGLYIVKQGNKVSKRIIK